MPEFKNEENHLPSARDATTSSQTVSLQEASQLVIVRPSWADRVETNKKQTVNRFAFASLALRFRLGFKAKHALQNPNWTSLSSPNVDELPGPPVRVANGHPESQLGGYK